MTTNLEFSNHEDILIQTYLDTKAFDVQGHQLFTGKGCIGIEKILETASHSDSILFLELGLKQVQKQSIMKSFS